MNIGIFLKQLRHEKQYTLSQLAQRLNMSVSFLSQIENGKISPSLNSLEELLKLYSINFSDFFRQVEQNKYIVLRKSETSTIEVIENKLRITMLASKLQNNALVTYIFELEDDAEIDTVVLPREVNGERIVYIIKGRIRVAIDNDSEFILDEGDSINYKSYVSCRIINEHEGVSRILVSGMPPILK